MPATYLSKINLPVDVSGTTTIVEFTIKDAEARQMIEDLGNALYWIGVTTTELEDGSTTSTITVGGETVTARLGGMASYDGLEFVWNGSAWQAMGHANFGDLAFKSSAEGTYTPAGSVTLTGQNDGTTATVNSITAVGSLPYFTVSGETATYVSGTLPTKGSDTTVVTGCETYTATFTGTQATVTVE